jgi:iron complex transport system ATP-binding protein
MPEARLEASGLEFAYGATAVLNGVDVQVAPGEALGVIGPNGAGKSTLLRLLAGLARPRAGEVRLDGRPLHSWREAELARAVAVVFQAEHVPFPFTVRELVTLGRHPHAPGGLGWRRADRERVTAVLERLALGELAERTLHELSGGEHKRVMLARALAQEPRFLLLDEPTAALDLHHQVALLEELTALKQAHGLGLVAILHDLNLVAQFCDRVVLLDQGRVRAQGRPEEVLQYALLKEVFGVELYIGVDELTGKLHLHPVLGPSSRSTLR